MIIFIFIRSAMNCLEVLALGYYLINREQKKKNERLLLDEKRESRHDVHSFVRSLF